MTKGLVPLFALFLAGCGAAGQEDEASHEARWAEGQAAANAEEIAQLKQRITDLEEQVERNDDYFDKHVDAAIEDLTVTNGEIDRLTQNQTVFQENIDYLRALHGRPPVPSN